MSRRAGASVAKPTDAAPSPFIDGKDPKVRTVRRLELVCSLPYQQTPEQLQKSYVLHPLFRETTLYTFPARTDLHCYHCVHPFETPPLFLPIEYRPERREYVGFGVFCSPGCAKRYAIERPTFNTPNQMTHIAQLAREMGVTNPVCPAPPQLRLKIFGGDLSIDEFRAMSQQGVSVILHVPPFVTHAMVFEQRRKAQQTTVDPVASVDDAPQPIVLHKARDEGADDRWKVKGLTMPLEPTMGDTTAMEMDHQPLEPAYLKYMEEKRKEGPKAADAAQSILNPSAPSTAAAATAPVKGSVMKRQGGKQSRANKPNAAKATKTITDGVVLPSSTSGTSKPNNDAKRGSLRAFMKHAGVEPAKS